MQKHLQLRLKNAASSKMAMGLFSIVALLAFNVPAAWRREKRP